MLLDQYSISRGESLNRQTLEQTRSKNRHSLLIPILTGMALLFLFLSAYHSRNVLSQIEEKEIRVMKLKKSYQNLLIENDKIQILLSEIRQNPESSRILIKILGDFQFRKEAERIQEDYLKAQEEEGKNEYFGYYMVLGMMLVGLARLLYLEFSKKDRIKNFL